MRIRTAWMCGALLAGAGCAHLPDATVRYYLAKSQVGFKVIRTAACDADGNLIVATAVTPSVAHSADRDAQPAALRLADLRGTFADTDVAIGFYDDGRLKGVNATATGQGEAVLKTVVSLASTLAAAAVKAPPPSAACDFIAKAGKGKPLSLAYEGTVDVTLPVDRAQPLDPTPDSRLNATRLSDAVGGVCAFYRGSEPLTLPLDYAKRDGDVLLAVRQPALAHVAVKAGGRSGGCDLEPVWDGRLPVAQLGTAYELPIPRAPVFGKQVFAVSFAESGALSSVEYGANTGAGPAIEVANAAASAVTGAMAAKAAELKAESDLIEQQQRLVRCTADPASCK